MLFDTHTHPYITFKKSPDTILENFFRDRDNLLVSIACDRETSLQSIKLAKKYSWVYATIGFHPCDLPYSSHSSLQSSHNTSLDSPLRGEVELQEIATSFPTKGKEFKTELSCDTQSSSQFFSLQERMGLQIDKLKDLYHQHERYIVAVWETGLDYYHLASIAEKTGLTEEQIKNIQKDYFRAQIRLAHELDLPFVIHARESNDDVLDILTEERAKNYVFHCYSEDRDFAHKVLKQNPEAMFWFWGTLTFKKSRDLQEVARTLPLSRILIETDAPFLTPEPLRGREENEPYFVSHVLTKLQELRSESPEEVKRAVYENGKRFYRID